MEPKLFYDNQLMHGLIAWGSFHYKTLNKNKNSLLAAPQTQSLFSLKMNRPDLLFYNHHLLQAKQDQMTQNTIVLWSKKRTEWAGLELDMFPNIFWKNVLECGVPSALMNSVVEMSNDEQSNYCFFFLIFPLYYLLLLRAINKRVKCGCKMFSKLWFY